MKKNKIFLPMIGLLAFAMGLVGCNKPAENSGDKSNQSSQVTPQKETIKVTDPDNKNAGELEIEKTLQLKASVDGVTWASADAKIATVDNTGKVTAVAAGEVKIKATKEGYYDGSYNLTVKRAAALAKVPFEKAEHYAADGWWGTADDGWSPIYARSEGNASDGQCIAHLDNGDKETLTFTSSAAIKAELVIMMASSSGVEDMSTVMGVKFNNADIAMTGKALEATESNSEFGEFSLGEQDIKSGENVLELSFLASAPYIDDLAIYSKQQATIAVKEAPAKDRIEVQLPADATGLTAYIGETTQINLTKPTDKTGISYVSDKETVATVDQTGKVTGVALGTANITIKKDGMYSARVEVVVEKKVVEGEIRVEAEDTSNDLPSGFNRFTDRTTGIQNGHSGGAYITGYNVSEACTLEYEFTSPKAQTMQLVIAGASHYQMDTDFVFGVDCTLKLNGEVVTCPATAKIESNPVMGAPTVEVTIGNVNVKNGANTFVIDFAERAPALDCYRFLPLN